MRIRLEFTPEELDKFRIAGTQVMSNVASFVTGFAVENSSDHQAHATLTGKLVRNAVDLHIKPDALTALLDKLREEQRRGQNPAD